MTRKKKNKFLIEEGAYPSTPKYLNPKPITKASGNKDRKKKPLPPPGIDTISYIINSNFIKGLPMFIAGGIITGLLIFLIKPTPDSPLTKAENELIEQTTSDIINIIHEDTQHLEDEFDKVIINPIGVPEKTVEDEVMKEFNDILAGYYELTEQSKAPYGQHLLKKTNSRYLADL